MADYAITPVSEFIPGYKPQTTSLGDMINAARGGIALSKEAQANRERLGLQEFMSNPDNFQTEGRIDIDKVNAAIPKIAPLTGRDVMKNFAEVGHAQTQAESAKQNLTQDQKNLVGQTFNILGKAGINDKQTYFKAMDDLVQTNPGNKSLARLVDSYKTIWSKFPDNAPFAQIAQTGAQTLLSVPQQETAFRPQPGTINTGAAVFPTITQPSVAGLPPTQQVGNQPLAVNQLGPSQRAEATGRVDMNNNPTYYVRDAQGNILGESTIPAGVAPGAMPGQQMPTPMGGNVVPPQPVVPGANMPAPAAPANVVATPVAPRSIIQAQPLPAAPANAPARMPAGESPTTLDAANKLRIDVRNAAGQAPVQNFNNNQIIKLADDVITGKGANFVGALSGGYAAIPWTSDNATNLNQLGHYMALQTSSLAASSGLGGTDAGRAIAGQISGTTDWTPQAIKQTARVNRALTTGTELFNQGIDNAFNRTKNPFSAAEFQQRWTQTLGADGINAVRLYDAMRNNDKEAIREVVTAAGGPNSQEYKNLVGKIGAMQKLIGGQ